MTAALVPRAQSGNTSADGLGLAELEALGLGLALADDDGAGLATTEPLPVLEPLTRSGSSLAILLNKTLACS